MPPDALRNQMLLRRYFCVTFNADLNAVFEPICYIATENGQKRPNFGGDVFMRISYESLTICDYSRYFLRLYRDLFL